MLTMCENHTVGSFHTASRSFSCGLCGTRLTDAQVMAIQVKAKVLNERTQAKHKAEADREAANEMQKAKDREAEAEAMRKALLAQATKDPKAK